MTRAVPLSGEGGSGIIGPDGDVDWWSFGVDEAGWWTIDTTDSVDKNFDASFLFYTPEGDLWYTIREPEDATVWLGGAGVWTIMVTDEGGGGDEDFYYSLQVESGGRGFVTEEPDDEQPTILVDLSESAVVLATCSGPGDVDRFQVLIPEQEGVGLQYLYVGQETRYAFDANTYPPLGLQDSAGTVVMADQASIDDYVLPGEYTVSVGVGRDGMDAIFNLSATPSSLTGEPDFNDEQAFAELITSGFAGRIVKEGDEDWWRLADGPPPAGVQCWGAVGSTLQDLSVELVDSMGVTRCSGSWVVSCTPEEVGYGFAIRLTSATAGENAWYVCSAGWTPDDGGDGGD